MTMSIGLLVAFAQMSSDRMMNRFLFLGALFGVFSLGLAGDDAAEASTGYGVDVVSISV